MSPCDRLVTCPGTGIGSSSSPANPELNKWKTMDGLYIDNRDIKTGSTISRNSLAMYCGQHCRQWVFENSSKEANLQTISPILNITFLTHTKCSYRGLYTCHIMTLTHSHMMLNNNSWSTCDWHIIQRQHKVFLPPSNWAVNQTGTGQHCNMRAENRLSSPQACQGIHRT